MRLGCTIQFNIVAYGRQRTCMFSCMYLPGRISQLDRISGHFIGSLRFNWTKTEVYRDLDSKTDGISLIWIHRENVDCRKNQFNHSSFLKMKKLTKILAILPVLRAGGELVSRLAQWYQNKDFGPKWTVQKGESGRSLNWTVARKWSTFFLESVQIHYFRSYILFLLDRPLLDFRTVHFNRPSTFSLLDRPV